MGFSDWFNFKSKAERERDKKAFEQWAFPYGQPQRDKVAGILKQLLPEEPAQAAMAVFLVGREGYIGSVREDAAEVAAKDEEKKLTRVKARVITLLPNGRKKQLLSRYVALIIADSKVDEALQYPSIQELLEAAEQLEPVLKKTIV